MHQNTDLENLTVAATPGGIEQQEAQGQQELITSSELPKEMLGCTRENLEAMGIVFGADVDDIFVKVTLPEGWVIKATDHSMWSHLVDEAGKQQASIFYKAAFYDRKAHIQLPRLGV